MSFLAELRRRWWLLVIAVVLLALFFASQLATFYTDVLWFDSLGYASVFWTLLGTRVGLGVLAGLVVFVLVGANLLVARRAAPAYRIPSQQEESIERYREALEPYMRPLLLGVAAVVGLLSGVSMAGEWRRVLLFLNGGSFGVDDPQFGRDVGYFVFELPFWELVNSWLFTTLAVVIVLSAIAHYLFGGIRPQSAGQKLTPQVNVHLSLLLAALVAVRAWGFVLDQHLLSYSERGTVTGLSYTDVNAQLLAFQVLAVIAAIIALLFLANIWLRTWLVPAGGVGLLIIAAIVLAGIYPAVIQRFQVEPQELEREREFISRNLEFTRYGFGIRYGNDDRVVTAADPGMQAQDGSAGGEDGDSGGGGSGGDGGPRGDIEVADFAAEPTLQPEQVKEEAGTLSALRMWDPAILLTNFEQQQQLRQFYEFRNVDVDRYHVDEADVGDGGTDLLQVMLSAREINLRNLPEGRQTWENRRLVFTHGFGLVAADVNSATDSGDPVLLAKDMPMNAAADEFAVENPRLYYGEQPPEYSIVGATRNEFDFPTQAGQDKEYRYDGSGGVPTGSWTNRLAFALRFNEVNFLLTEFITGESRVMYQRAIRDRVERIAPFLELDHDPYPVMVDDGEGGRVKWIQDAYTTSNRMPYSERQNLGQLTLAEQRELEAVQVGEEIQLRERLVPLPGIEGEANYLRNSVKVVVDAYDGTVDLYVTEQDDPIIDAWQRLFPDVFKPIDEAPEKIRQHFRYPEDGFRVQAAVFEKYHVRDAGTFYQGEDEWAIPADRAFELNQGQDNTGEERPLRPHYQLLRLPGQDTEEFSLVQQFLRRQRPNLSGMLVARNDGEHLGELMSFDVPGGEQTLGPGQLLARLDRQSSLANLIGVWNESNADVVYGNTIIVPVGPSLVYAQPVFLQPESSEPLPQLSVVALSDAEELVWSTSLGGALRQMYGDAVGSVEVAGRDPSDVLSQLRIPERLREEENLEEIEEAEEGGQQLSGEVVDLVNQAAQKLEEADQALADGDLGRYQELNREANELLQQARERMGDGEPLAAPGG